MEAILVTHNSARELKSCGRTLASFRRVIAVDSGSTDNSAALARNLGAEVVQRANEGFGSAANVGVETTIGDIFAVLNPDIRFDDGARVLRAMHRHFAQNDRLGVVAPALRLPDGSIQDSARIVPTPANLVRRRWAARRSGEVAVDRPSTVPWVVAACIFVRRRAFEDIGGFDRRFFLYFEDVDLCVRMRRAGWEVLIDPAIVVRHEHRGESRSTLTSRAAREHIKSAVRFYAKHPRYALGFG